jgi:hypothetical protein
MEITDLAVSEETGSLSSNSGAQLLITGGKDTKVKVWLIADLIQGVFSQEAETENSH